MKHDKNFDEILKEESNKLKETLETNENVDNVYDTFKVEITTKFLNLRKNPGVNSERIGFAPLGIHDVIKTDNTEGSKKGWGLLSDNSGWISLDFAKRI